VPNLELNGRAPDLAETHRLATTNYGHFTTMQVRDGKVRGLALHLARLDDGNEAFFSGRMGIADEHRLRELIRHALGDTKDASVRVRFVPGEDEQAPPDVLVAVSDPVADVRGAPLRVRTIGYEREWPEHKHALFLGPGGRVREGTTWNVAFWDGEMVVWPQAPLLKGVTMVLLQVAMTMIGVPWSRRVIDASDLPDLLAAAAVNSRCPAQPIGSIDDVKFAEYARLAEVMDAAWATVPWDEI
jgi:branched-subunit amino acid aminotransferase/4-amino-4-deoxychorismate lyase